MIKKEQKEKFHPGHSLIHFSFVRQQKENENIAISSRNIVEFKKLLSSAAIFNCSSLNSCSVNIRGGDEINIGFILSNIQISIQDDKFILTEYEIRFAELNANSQSDPYLVHVRQLIKIAI